MITAPSTIKPKSKAPKDIRLALTPKSCIMEMAKSMDSGITEAMIRPARKLPTRSTSTKMTMSAPSIRFFSTVAMVRLTSFSRSKKVLMVMPSGSPFLTSSKRALTLWITFAAFSPLSIITIPNTISPSPLWLTAP